MNNLPTLSEFLKEEEKKSIRAVRKNGLVSFKYTEQTVYTRNWNSVTLNSRGIIFEESSGKVIARPFKKFFNFSELCNNDGSLNDNGKALSIYPEFVPNLTGKFRSSDKMDGSCGIVYKYQNKYFVNTCGSFNSDQAIWATNYINSGKQIKTNMMKDGYTYLFEIIWSEDKHPINYNGINDMFLIGIIDNETGDECDNIEEIANQINAHFAKIYTFTNFNEVVDFATKLPKTKEGVVVTFENGYKCKIKGEEFLKLQKIFHSVTIEKFWEVLDPETGKIPISYLSMIPEEFENISKQYVEELEMAYNSLYQYTMNIGMTIMKLNLSKKDRYFKICEVESNLAYRSIILTYCNNIEKGNNDLSHFKQLIHKTIKPLKNKMIEDDE